MMTLAFGCLSLWGQEQAPATTDAYIELMRKDVRSQKASLVGQNMNLTAAEASAFWPVYQKYEAQQQKLGDERVALIKDYAANYQQMTDQKADELVNRIFALEDKVNQLKRQYYAEFKKAIPGVKAARFVQIENQIQRLIDLQIASQIPLVQ
jgi:hypothetical protein